MPSCPSFLVSINAGTNASLLGSDEFRPRLKTLAVLKRLFCAHIRKHSEKRSGGERLVEGKRCHWPSRKREASRHSFGTGFRLWRVGRLAAERSKVSSILDLTSRM